MDSSTTLASEPQRGSPTALERGSTLGRYVLLERVGAGGMGVVYAAYDPELDRKIALKLISSARNSARQQARLLSEAQTMAQLAHPNVVTIHDVGRYGDGVFLAMELVHGETLRRWARSSHPWRETLAVLLGAGRGLAAAHASGIVHGDFKPENVMVDASGRARVLDFGLAHFESPDASSRSSDVADRVDATTDEPPARERVRVVGTPAYLAPERLRGSPPRAASDQFAFCVTAHEVLCGEHPFGGGGPNEVTTAILEGRRASTLAARRVPTWLTSTLERGMDPDPGRRYASMDDLLAAASSDPTGRRRRTVALGVLAVGVAGSLGAGAYDRARLEARCAREGAVFEEVWSPGRRDELRSDFDATGLPYAPDAAERTVIALDRLALEWAQERMLECRAPRGGEADPADHARSVSCFTDIRDSAAALLRALDDPDALAIQRSVDAASTMQRPKTCRDRDLLAHRVDPPFGVARAAAVLIDGAALRVRTLVAMGRYADAHDAANELVAMADGLGLPSRRASARYLRGRTAAGVGDRPGAEEDLRAAYFEAVRSAHRLLSIDAAISMAWVVNDSPGRATEANLWIDLADAELERLGRDDGLREADVHLVRAALLGDGGRAEEALEESSRALQLQQALQPPGHPLVARAFANVAAQYADLGRYDAALDASTRAVQLLEAALGPDHPELIPALSGRHRAEAALGRSEASRRTCERLARLARESDVDRSEVPCLEELPSR